MSLPRPSPSGEGRSLVRDEGKLQAGCSLRPGEAGLTGVPGFGSQPHLHLHCHLLFLSHLSCGGSSLVTQPAVPPLPRAFSIPSFQNSNTVMSRPPLLTFSSSFGTRIKCPTFPPRPGRLCVTFPGHLTSFFLAISSLTSSFQPPSLLAGSRTHHVILVWGPFHLLDPLGVLFSQNTSLHQALQFQRPFLKCMCLPSLRPFSFLYRRDYLFSFWTLSLSEMIFFIIFISCLPSPIRIKAP